MIASGIGLVVFAIVDPPALRSSVSNACRQRAGNVPTMVLSETRSLWLYWVVRGGIRYGVRLSAKRMVYPFEGYSPSKPRAPHPPGLRGPCFHHVSVAGAYAVCGFRCLALNAFPFFQIDRVSAAILRARVSRAMGGCMPLASILS